MAQNVREGTIQKAILDNLMYRGILCWREARIPTPIRRGRKIVAFRRADPHTIGIPDVFCVIKGKLIGIEVKTAKGKQSDEQIAWQEKLEKAGGTYILARSWEDVEEVIKDF